MAKKIASVQDVLAETAKILQANNGKIPYTAYRAALDSALPNNQAALSQAIKFRALKMVIEGVDSGMQPLLFVVSELPKG